MKARKPRNSIFKELEESNSQPRSVYTLENYLLRMRIKVIPDK